MADYIYDRTRGWLFMGQPVTEPEDLAMLNGLLKRGYTAANEGENGIEPVKSLVDEVRTYMKQAQDAPKDTGPLGAKPKWWPAGEPWPPMKRVPDEEATAQNVDKDGNPLGAVYKDVIDYDKIAQVKNTQKALDVDVGDPEKPDSVFRDPAEAQAAADAFNARGGVQVRVTPSGTGYKLEPVPDAKPDKANYRPERYTDPQTGITYERTSPEGDWKDITPATKPAKPAKPDPILSFDEMIYKAVGRGDIASAVAIDAFRDSLGVDRLAVANNVMSFWLSNADAATIRGWMANPGTMPPMLGQALQIYSQALSPTGGVDINAVLGQNAQLQPSLEQDIMAGMQSNPNWHPKDPYTGEDLLQKMASQPFPTVGGTPSPAGPNGQVTGESAAAANAADPSAARLDATRQAEDEALANGRLQSPTPGVYDPAMQDRANASTGVYGQPWATQGTGRGGINPSVGPSRNVYGEDVESPYLTSADQQPKTVYSADIDEATGEPRQAPPKPPVYGVPEIDEATGEPRNALPPAMADAKSRYDYFRAGDADQGIAPQTVSQASQNSGYYGAEWDADIAARDAAPKPKPAQPYGDSSAILGSYADAAQRREDAKRKRPRSPVYSA